MEGFGNGSAPPNYGASRGRTPVAGNRLAALQGALDTEDRRVKELTEGILYDFLPAALNVMLPRCEDPLQELDADRCRAVASAALAVSALMNAPPGFLEFLLCVPWRKLSQLYPKSDSIDKLVSNLQVTDEERRKLVNTRIDPLLMGTILDFLYKDKHADSVPPLLHLTPVSPLQPDDKSAPVVVRETVAAVLDGATPLHCAALRGNPAQVDHLLYCGADPTVRTAAGELPVELVPLCNERDRSSGSGKDAGACKDPTGLGGSGGGAAVSGAACAGRSCRCMGPHDQEVWECRSRLARSLIARRCLISFGVGLFAWLRLVIFCLLCMLGQAGCHVTVSRPVVERHIETRRQQKAAAARARATALVSRMRSEAEQGHTHLEQAKRECLESPSFQNGPPDISQMCFTDPTKAPPPPPPQMSQIQIHDINFHLQESGTSSTGDELASEKAFKCFVRAVHALQSLDLHGDTVPQVFADLVAPGAPESRETHVLEDEQADLYSCWAESVLLKFRGCTCPGCAALAIQAVRMAHIQATRLFGKVDRIKNSLPDRWRAVGQALARVVYVHICLLLETEAQASPTRSLVWRAEQCLREWDRLERSGLTQGAGVLDPRHVAALQRWAKTADSDLYLAEALHGSALPPTKTLQEVVLGAVTYTVDQQPILARPVNAEVVAALDQATTLACLPSPLLAHIVRSVVANATAELAAAARLQELVGAKGAATGGGTSEAVAALSEAIQSAERFRARLEPELEAAQELRAKWLQRVSAVEKLEGAVEGVRSYAAQWPLSFTLEGAAGGGQVAGEASGGSSRAGSRRGSLAGSEPVGEATRRGGEGEDGAGPAGAGPGGVDVDVPPDLAEWDRRMKQLEAAMNEAKDANVSITKAKRLLKEMQAVAAAAEASRNLEAVMGRRPSGPVQLKLALNKAEAAASHLSSLGGNPPCTGLTEVLGPLMAAARRRLDTERAAEALTKAAASYRTLADLARLEAAIYNAKKIGAEELDPDSYRTSLELRGQLQEAARVRGVLEAALRTLQNQLRPEDAEALERALQEAGKWEELLAPDLAKARKALEQWRCMSVSDAKLARLLREGASTAVLARAIQEAAASGVKVQHAKRVLKLMQALEAALASSEGGAAERYAAVRQRLEAAEAGGVTAGPLPEQARKVMGRLLAQCAGDALEAALKPHSDWSVAQRIACLKEALEKAEAVVESAGGEDAAEGGGKGGGGGQQGERAANGAGPVGRQGSKGKRSTGGSGLSSGEVSTATLEEVSEAAATGPSTSTAADGTAVAASDSDEAFLGAVRELVRKARRLLEEDQAELARIERERQEAERAKKEAQEREKAERARQDAERVRREKAEAAERERALAEKREKAKADKARQQQQQQQQQQKAAEAAQSLQQQQAGGKQQQGGKAGGKVGNGKGAAAVAAGPPAAAAAAAQGAAGRHGGAGGSQEPVGRGNGAQAKQQQAPAAAADHGHGPGGKAGGNRRRSSSNQQMPTPQAAAAAVPGPALAPTRAAAAMVSSPPGTAPLAPSAAVLAALASSTTPSPSSPPIAPPATAAAALRLEPRMHLHARGDSLESLGEVAHKLKIIDALDLDGELSGPPSLPPGLAAALEMAGSPQDPLAISTSYPPGPLGLFGRATSAAEAAAAGGGLGGAAAAAGGIPGGALSSFGRSGSAGGSAAATLFGAAESALLDQTPSQRTSSIMSSVASADDVMLQSAVGGASGGNASLSTISTSQIASAGQDGGTASGGQGPIPAAASDGSPGTLGGAAAAKPRFGLVDLGGASWGLDSPMLGQAAAGSGSASLFPGLQHAGVGMGDFAMLGSAAGKQGPDAVGTAGGWSATGSNSGGASRFAPASTLGLGGMNGSGPGASGGGEDAGGGSTRQHRLSGNNVGAGLAGGSLDGGLAAMLPDAGMSLLNTVLASPRAAGVQTLGPGGGGGGPGGQVLLPGGAAGLTQQQQQMLLQQMRSYQQQQQQQQQANAMAAANLSRMGSVPTAGQMQRGGLLSVQLSLAQQQQQQQQQAAANAAAGSGMRGGFWTPPSFQGVSPGDATGDAGAFTHLGGALHLSGLQHLNLASVPQPQQQQQQQQLNNLGLHALDWSSAGGDLAALGLNTLQGAGVGMGGAGASTAGLLQGVMSPQRGAGPPAGAGGSGSSGRICRFYLQGFCRDGERCRYAHSLNLASPSPSAGAGAGAGAAAAAAAATGSLASALQLLQQHQQQQQQQAAAAAAANGTHSPLAYVPTLGQSSTVGSFAFGAPGAEAFAREPLPEALLAKGPQLGGGAAAAGQQRPGAGAGGQSGGASTSVSTTSSMSGLPAGLSLIDRSQLGNASGSGPMQGGMGAAQGGRMQAAGGGGAGAGGMQPQAVQLRDSTTGATFNAVLTMAAPQPVAQQQQQQQQLLMLPDDLTFSPPSGPGTPAALRGGFGANRR